MKCQKKKILTTTTDLVETINLGHAAFINELRSLKASNDSFPHSLNSAALNLYLTVTDDKLKGKLTHVHDLLTEVRRGFENVNRFMSNMSEDEKDHMNYCQSRFILARDKIANKSESHKDEPQTFLELPSRKSNPRKLAGLELEKEVDTDTNLKDGKISEDFEGQQNASATRTPRGVRKRKGNSVLVLMS